MAALKLHAGIYFGREDGTAADELKAKELVSKITDAASGGSYTEEMAALVKELDEVKKRLAEKKEKDQTNNAMAHRLKEVIEAIDSLKETDIQFSNDLVRKLIECVRVMPTGEIEVSFIGGVKKTAPLNQ